MRTLPVVIALGLVLLAASALAGISGVVVPRSTFFDKTVPFAGFNSFYAQLLTPTQTYMQDVSDYLITSGLQAAWGGTIIAGVDENWAAVSGGVVTRSGGNPVPTGNFTSMTTLTAHIKANGQVPLLYRDGGQVGCQSEDWSAATLSSDLTFFVNTWGFQGAKLDGCSLQTPVVLGGRTVYPAAKATLDGLGVSYILTFGWANGTYNGYTGLWPYQNRAGTAARNSFDIGSSATPCATSFAAMMNNIWALAHHRGVVGPGHYLDADYLMANNNGTGGTLTTDEAVTQMALTAVFSSPWVLGCDPRNLGATELSTLKNADLISVLKDSAVGLGQRVGGANGPPAYEQYCKRLATSGTRALVMVNENASAAASLTADPSLCGIDTTQTYTYKNVLTGATTAGATSTFSTGSINAHASGVFLISAATENNATCWATNPGGTGQIADGFPGGCAFATDNNGNPAGGFPTDGTTTTTATAISTTGLTNPAAQGCYQKQRKGVIATDEPNEAGIEYLADNLVAGATYHYRIHLAETEGKTTGQRLFNLTINTGIQQVAALASYDIYVAASSTLNKAVIAEGNVIADHGYLSFDFEPLNPPTGVPTTGCIEVIKQ